MVDFLLSSLLKVWGKAFVLKRSVSPPYGAWLTSHARAVSAMVSVPHLYGWRRT